MSRVRHTGVVPTPSHGCAQRRGCAAPGVLPGDAGAVVGQAPTADRHPRPVPAGPGRGAPRHAPHGGPMTANRIVTIDLPARAPSGSHGPAAATRTAEEPQQTATRLVVLIPAHNEERHIEATVRSVQAQSHAPERVIVLADNCTDGTVDRAREAG